MSSDEVGEGVRNLSLEASNKKVTLRSSEGEAFEVEETAAVESELIKDLIEAGCADQDIPLNNVTGATLGKIVEYCKKHAGGKYDRKDEELKKWDAEYIEVDVDTLYYIFLGANYMSVNGLLDLCGQSVADKIKGKSVEEIRETFNIENDFTPEEEKAIREKHPWAF